MHVGRRFELLLERYPHPDGRRWSGYQIDNATGGVVSRSYVTNLRKGRIENPGYDKLKALAKAMGFPAQLWFEENLGDDEGVRVEPSPERGDLAGRLEHLFGVIKNERTGEPYTNKEVARMSLGDLSEEEVGG